MDVLTAALILICGISFGLLVPQKKKAVAGALFLSVLYVVVVLGMALSSHESEKVASWMLLSSPVDVREPGLAGLLVASYAMLLGASIAVVRYVIRKQRIGPAQE